MVQRRVMMRSVWLINHLIHNIKYFASSPTPSPTIFASFNASENPALSSFHFKQLSLMKSQTKY